MRGIVGWGIWNDYSFYAISEIVFGLIFIVLSFFIFHQYIKRVPVSTFMLHLSMELVLVSVIAVSPSADHVMKCVSGMRQPGGLEHV